MQRKVKILTAALVAVGLFASLEYKTLAQSTQSPSQSPTQSSPGTTQPIPDATRSEPGATESNLSINQPNRDSTQTQPSTTQPNSTTTGQIQQLSAQDKQFITEAAQGGMAEVQLGKLALQRASSQQVRDYAQHMIDEHAKVNQELMALAKQKGVTPPKTIGQKNEAVRAKLAKLSGSEFDKAYMQEAGVKAHAQQEALFRRQAEQGQDPDSKAFAAKVLPTVQAHLQEAQKQGAGN
jgi:putative membrane protein